MMIWNVHYDLFLLCPFSQKSTFIKVDMTPLIRVIAIFDNVFEPLLNNCLSELENNIQLYEISTN